MKLVYHEGKNFGDALNPLIFNHFLGNRLNEDDSEILLGIGSILGLKRPTENTNKVIVFSSGYAANMSSTYGELPNAEELKKYEFICVRGPLTAKALKLSSRKAVCDGAVLITDVIPKDTSIPKKYNYSFMPHVGSLKFYSKWKELLHDLNIHLIDPTDPVEKVILEVQKSKIIFCEAMHGAIISDSYRIPWIPLVCYKTINSFKWKDYCASLKMEYSPHHCPSLFDKEMVQEIFKNKFKFLPNSVAKGIGGFYYQIRNRSTKGEVIRFFENLKDETGQLSETYVLERRRDRLRELMGDV